MPIFSAVGGTVQIAGKDTCPMIYPSGGQFTGGSNQIIFNNDGIALQYFAAGAWFVLPADALFDGSEKRPYWCKYAGDPLTVNVYGNSFPGKSEWQYIDEPLTGSSAGTRIFSGITSLPIGTSGATSVIQIPGNAVSVNDALTARVNIRYGVDGLTGQYFSVKYNDQLGNAQTLGPTYSVLTLIDGFSPGQISGGGFNTQIFTPGGGFGASDFIEGQGPFNVDPTGTIEVSYALLKKADEWIGVMDFTVMIEKG